MEFNKKLQALRNSRGLTQEQLASALFVSRAAVSKWESGRGYPNLDSLRDIAALFSVTVDELLSGEELLCAAKEGQMKATRRTRDLTFGLLDCAMLVLLFLPLFGNTGADGTVLSVSLIALRGVSLYLKAFYLIFVGCSLALGIITLALQWYSGKIWVKLKSNISILLQTGGVLLFIISSQPYAATLTFAFLVIKTLILIKER